MTRLKRISLTLAAVVSLGGVGSWYAVQSWVKSHFTADEVVRQLEEHWNCRVRLDGLTVDLFAMPARLDLRNLLIYPRDSEIGKPQAQRASTKLGAIMSVKQLILEVDTKALLNLQLHVRKLNIDLLAVREEIAPDGGSLLHDTFSKPKLDLVTSELKKLETTEAPPPALVQTEPAQQPVKKPVPQAMPPTVPETAQTAGNSSAASLPFGLVVDELSITQGVFHCNNRRSKTRLDLNDLNLHISEVDVDTGNLAQHNTCKLQFDTRVIFAPRIKIADKLQEQEMANFQIAANGTVHPFAEATGEFEPSVTASVKLKKDSVFGGTSTIGAAGSKDKTLGMLKQYAGVDLSSVVIGGALQEDAVMELQTNNGRTEFMTDATLAFPDYRAGVLKGSWLDGAEDRHEAHVFLMPGPDLAKRLTEQINSSAIQGMAPTILSALSDDKGAMMIEILSSDRLSKPKIRPTGKAIEKMLQGLLGGGLLKGLFGK